MKKDFKNLMNQEEVVDNLEELSLSIDNKKLKARIVEIYDECFSTQNDKRVMSTIDQYIAFYKLGFLYKNHSGEVDFLETILNDKYEGYLCIQINKINHVLLLFQNVLKTPSLVFFVKNQYFYHFLNVSEIIWLN